MERKHIYETLDDGTKKSYDVILTFHKQKTITLLKKIANTANTLHKVIILKILPLK